VSGSRSSRRSRRIKAALALGAGAAAAAGWVLQHRSVSRSVVGEKDIESEGLALPDDVVHRYVETDDGGRIHVVERGSGPPIVLLHGFMLDSTIWAHQFRDLSDRHRVIAVDLRGHGLSLPGTAGFGPRIGKGVAAGRASETFLGAAPMAQASVGAPGIRRLAADVATVLEELDLSQALLVGHSMGGMVALQLAQDSPSLVRQKVSGIVLTSTMAGPFVQLPGWAGVARVTSPIPARAVLLADRLGVRALPSRDLRYWTVRLGFGGDAPPAQVHFVEAIQLATSSRTLAGLLPSLALFDLSSNIDSIDQPVLVVVGSHDHLTPPRMARRMAAALPNSQMVELPRCGHMPMMERPHEFSHLLEEFAAKTEHR